MARIKNEEEGLPRGLVGSVVFAKWRGMTVVRTRPTQRKKPASEKQLFQQRKMRVVMQFLKTFKPLIDPYFGEAADLKSRFNEATSYYLKEGLHIDEQEVTIDTNKVILTKGGLRGIEDATLAYESPQQVKLTWKYAPDDAGQHPDDRLYVALYIPSLGKQNLFINLAKRADTEVMIPLEPEDVDKTIYYWAGFIGHDKQQASWSLALGSLEE